MGILSRDLAVCCPCVEIQRNPVITVDPDRNFEGYLSVDIAPPADIISDLREVWPWRSSSIDEILAYDIFEHLPDKIHTMNELWRVLVPGGKACVEVPTVRGVGSVCDPTHCSYWSAGDFEYYEIGNYARERFRLPWLQPTHQKWSALWRCQTRQLCWAAGCGIHNGSQSSGLQRVS